MNTSTFNKYDVVSNEALTFCDVTVNCILLIVIALLGIVGNIFNVIILSYQGLYDSTNVILMSLSLTDLAYDIMMPVRRIRCVVSQFDFVKAEFFDVITSTYIIIPTRLISLISSGHIVLISLERMMAVYFPMRVSGIFTVKKTSLYLTCIYLFWIAFSSPFFQMFTALTVNINNTTYLALTFSDSFLLHVDTYNFINLFIIANIRGPVSFTIILVASIATGHRLYRAGQKRLKMTSLKSKTSLDLKAIRMLLVVCLVYLALALPGLVPTFMYFIDLSFVLNDGRFTNVYTLSEYFVDFLCVLSSSVNFIIYISMSRKFSSTYKNIFNIYRGSKKYKT